jgi:hypothetical protein
VSTSISTHIVSNHSYIGWLTATTWQSGCGGSAYFVGTIIQALFVQNIPNYVYERWQGSLIGLGALLLAVLFNTFLAKRLPMVEGLFVFCHVLGILLFIPLWILSPRREGGSPLVEFYNPNGWATTGIAFWVGSSPPVSALIGFDCSVHMGMLIH